MIELSEQTIIEQLVDRLAQRFPTVPGDKVAAVVNARYARFNGRPIRDYIPLFVERGARADLAQLSRLVAGRPQRGEPAVELRDETVEVAQLRF